MTDMPTESLTPLTTSPKNYSIDVVNIFEKAANIDKIDLSENQKKIHDKIIKIAKYIHVNAASKLKYGGFLLHGKPQNGKTEIARQVTRTLSERYPSTTFAFLDGASVAYSPYGMSERVVKDVFAKNAPQDGYKVIIFDDIDCVLLGRQMTLAREYQISISSVLFHALDNIKKDTIFIATTNKKENLDEALETRLISIEVSMPTHDELFKEIDRVVDSFDLLPATRKNRMKSTVISKIVVGTTGYRDVQRWLLDELVNGER